ncbi:MAG: hypothetical protein JWN98_1593 [Abditibacteriota bacterium]|nr:hypothetical protein [Abditibacteriota bacterium]
MKVLHIVEATQGGTRRHVLDLLPALSSRGVTCRLIYSSLRYPAFGQDATQLQSAGIHTRDVAMARGWSPTLDGRALRALVQQMQHERPDVVHCHSTKAGVLGRLATGLLQSTLKRRIPLVYTPHCVAFDTGLPHTSRRLARWIEKLLAPLTTHFIAVSHHEARALQHVLVPRRERLSVIHNGIDLEAFDALSLPELPRANANFSVACFGRLSAQKNQRALLAAWPRVQRAVPAAQLHFIGGGEDQSTLQGLSAAWKLQNSVTFAGEIAEPRPLYAHHHLIVQPSRWEGCPYSVLEAMAARRAVVAADVGGLREVLGNDSRAGILCKPCSPDALAAHIIALTDDIDCRQQLGDKARQRIETHFTLTEMVAKTLAVYESILA